MNAVIVDDEQASIDALRLDLLQGWPALQIDACFTKPAEAVAHLARNPPAMLFLDVHMPGMSGFELLDQLPGLHTQVVFCTAYDQYAVQAFRHHAIDYLLKPIDPDLLMQTMQKASRHHLAQQPLTQLLQTVLGADQVVQRQLALPTHEGLEFVQPAQVVRVQSHNNYTEFFFTHRKPLLICRTLKEVEMALARNQFIRIHQSHLINPLFISSYLRTDGGMVVMSTGDKLPISPQRRQQFLGLFQGVERQ